MVGRKVILLFLVRPKGQTINKTCKEDLRDGIMLPVFPDIIIAEYHYTKSE